MKSREVELVLQGMCVCTCVFVWVFVVEKECERVSKENKITDQ